MFRNGLEKQPNRTGLRSGLGTLLTCDKQVLLCVRASLFTYKFLQKNVPEKLSTSTAGKNQEWVGNEFGCKQPECVQTRACRRIEILFGHRCEACLLRGKYLFSDDCVTISEVQEMTTATSSRPSQTLSCDHYTYCTRESATVIDLSSCPEGESQTAIFTQRVTAWAR